MKRTRIYHGGPANCGSGGSGYTLLDRLFDELGTILLQGISGVLHIKPFTSIEADAGITVFGDADVTAFAQTTMDISGVGNAAYYSQTGKATFAGVGAELKSTSGQCKIDGHDVEIDANTTNVVISAANGQGKITGQSIDIEAVNVGGSTVVIKTNNVTNGNINTTSAKDVNIVASSKINITSHGNGIDITADAVNPATAINVSANTINLNQTIPGAYITIISVGGVLFPLMKTGVNQAAAGAIAGELWANSTTHQVFLGV